MHVQRPLASAHVALAEHAPGNEGLVCLTVAFLVEASRIEAVQELGAVIGGSHLFEFRDENLVHRK